MTLRAHLARTFLSLDPRGLGVLRLLLSCALGLDLLLRAAPLDGPLGAWLQLGLSGLVYLGLAVGWRTQLMQVGALIAHTSLVGRVVPLRCGADAVLQLLLVLSVLLPLGQRFSLDALLRSFRDRVEHVAADLDFAVRPARGVTPVVTLAALGLGLLLGPSQLDALHRAFARGRPRMRFFFDSDCGICFQAARLLARLDVFERIELRSNQDHAALPVGVSPELVEHTIVVVELDSGRVYLRSEGIARVCLALPLGTLPFAVLRTPGLRVGFEWLYDVLARNRRAVSVSLGLAACGIPVRPPEPVSDAAGPKPSRSPSRIWIVARELTVALLLLALGAYALSPPSCRSDSAALRDHAPGSARARSR